jgi:hypothetical protein
MLDSARSWSAWDTFGGGGAFSSMIKHDRLDTVARDLRQADDALSAFTRELADLHLEGIDLVTIGPLMSTFDVWFDNIFTDLAVRDRIIKAQGKVHEALVSVRRVVDDLGHRRTAIAEELAALDRERTTLLGG